MEDIFRSERLIYRAIEETDDTFLLSLNQDSLSYINTTPCIPTPQGKDSAIQRRRSYKDCMLAALICLQPQRTGDEVVPIGVVSMKDGNFQNGRHFRCGKLGITLSRDYRGKGFGREAIVWLLDWSFRRANLRKVTLMVYEYNTAAIGLYEKLGFVLEGKLRDEVWHEGRYWADLVFSMLEDEWRSLFRDASTDL